MKKCLHLKKTKPHWKRKPPKVITWRERKEAERAAKQDTHDRFNHSALFARLAEPQRSIDPRVLDSLLRGWR